MVDLLEDRDMLKGNLISRGFDSSPKLMNNLYIYIFAVVVILMYIPVFYEIYMLRKLLKSIAKKTEKLVE